MTDVTLSWNLARNPEKSSKFAEKMQNSKKKLKKSEIQLFNREKMLTILAEILRLKNGAKECTV